MAGFRSNRKEIESDVRLAFSRAVEETVGLARENAPVDEGTLRASITWRMVVDNIREELKARFGSSLRYAAMRELGGVIRPVRAKRLVWRDSEGRWHSAKEVIQAPGGKRGSPKHGKGYLRPAGEKFGSIFEKHLKRLGQ